MARHAPLIIDLGDDSQYLRCDLVVSEGLAEHPFCYSIQKLIKEWHSLHPIVHPFIEYRESQASSYYFT